MLLRLVHLVVCVVLFQRACKASLIGRPLYSHASEPDFNLDIANEDESATATPVDGEPNHNDAASPVENPWLIEERKLFDIHMQCDKGKKELTLNQSNVEFVTAVHVARCKAKCLQLFGSSTTGNERRSRGFLIPAACHTSTKCKSCEEACEVPYDDCEEYCGPNAECRIACYIHQSLRIQPETALIDSVTLSGLRLDRPRPICRNYTEESLTGFLLKWSLFNTTSRNFVNSSVPVVFIVENRNTSGTWTVLGMRTTGLVPITVETGAMHQYRVTPVTVDGVLRARTSLWTFASPNPGTFAAPIEANVMYQRGQNRRVKATIALTHRKYPSCYYSIDIALRDGTSAAGLRIRGKPYDLFVNDIGELDFDKNYTMSITSTDFTGTVEGRTNYTGRFQTVSCLDAFNHNFSICAPGPPSKVEAQTVSHSLRIRWTPPSHTSLDNRVLSYEVEVTKRPRCSPTTEAQRLFMKLSVEAPLNYIDVPAIDDDARYDVWVRARSEAGIGDPTIIEYYPRSSATPWAGLLFRILAISIMIATFKRLLERNNTLMKKIIYLKCLDLERAAMQRAMQRAMCDNTRPVAYCNSKLNNTTAE